MSNVCALERGTCKVLFSFMCLLSSACSSAFFWLSWGQLIGDEIPDLWRQRKFARFCEKWDSHYITLKILLFTKLYLLSFACTGPSVDVLSFAKSNFYSADLHFMKQLLAYVIHCLFVWNMFIQKVVLNLMLGNVLMHLYFQSRLLAASCSWFQQDAWEYTRFRFTAAINLFCFLFYSRNVMLIVSFV